jgi:hypothetical protein
MLTEIIAIKAIAKIATKILAPVADENKTLRITHKIISGVADVGVRDVRDALAIRRRKTLAKKELLG